MKVRIAASVVVAGILATVLAGCYAFAVPQTHHLYDASDGVSVTVGDVKLINAVVFTEDGVDGNFTGTAANAGTSDVTLTLQYQSGSSKVDVTVDVPAGATIQLGDSSGDGQIPLAGIDTPPGALLKVYVQYGTVPGKQIDVPVLDGSLRQYDSLLPTPMPTPTPTPTGSATPTPTPTP